MTAPFRCDYCDKNISSRGNMSKHIKSHLNKQRDMKAPSTSHTSLFEDENGVWPCPYCGNVSNKSEKSLQRHIRNTHMSMKSNNEHLTKLFQYALLKNPNNISVVNMLSDDVVEEEVESQAENEVESLSEQHSENEVLSEADEDNAIDSAATKVASENHYQPDTSPVSEASETAEGKKMVVAALSEPVKITDANGQILLILHNSSNSKQKENKATGDVQTDKQITPAIIDSTTPTEVVLPREPTVNDTNNRQVNDSPSLINGPASLPAIPDPLVSSVAQSRK